MTWLRSVLIVCVIGLLIEIRYTCAEDDPTTHLKSLGTKFLVTGFHAGWSGDSKRIVYGNFPSEAGLQVVEVATKKSRELTDFGKDPCWSPSKDNSLIVCVRGHVDEEEIWLVGNTSAKGEHRLLTKGGSPRWSADGKKIFFHSRGDGRIMSIAIGEDAKEFCSLPNSWYPVVSPDEKRVAFVEKDRFVIVTAADGKEVWSWALPGATGGLVDWSPDGKTVAFGGYGEEDGVGLWVMNVENGKVATIDSGPFTQPIFSPDGATLAIDLRANAKRREIWLLDTKVLSGLKFEDAKK